MHAASSHKLPSVLKYCYVVKPLRPCSLLITHEALHSPRQPVYQLKKIAGRLATPCLTVLILLIYTDIRNHIRKMAPPAVGLAWKLEAVMTCDLSLTFDLSTSK